jgi:hypothetical protein
MGDDRQVRHSSMNSLTLDMKVMPSPRMKVAERVLDEAEGVEIVHVLARFEADREPPVTRSDLCRVQTARVMSRDVPRLLQDISVGIQRNRDLVPVTHNGKAEHRPAVVRRFPPLDRPIVAVMAERRLGAREGQVLVAGE